MKPKTMILMMVAIGCGLAASYMTSRVIADRQPQDQVEEKVTVLVAKHNLTLNTFIKEPEKLFESRQYIAGQEPKKAIKDFTLLKDQRLNKPIAAEQFVTADDLLNKDQDGIASQMQKGMRGYAVRVSAETSAGGFILPQCRVDIVSVIDQGEKGRLAKIILQNITVVAVDQMPGRPEDKSAMVGATVTLEVTPEEAEVLTQAQEMGQLRLILRPFGDDAKVRTAGVSRTSILQGKERKQAGDEEAVDEEPAGNGTWGVALPDVPAKKQKEEPAPVEPKPEPKVHTMVIFNGDQVSRAVFTLDNEGHSDGNPVNVIKSEPAKQQGQKPAGQKPTGQLPVPTEK